MCVGVLGSILLCFFIGAGMTLRLVRITWGQFLRDHVPGLILAVVVGGLGWISVTALRGSAALPVLVLAGALAVMSTAALAGVLLFPGFFLGPDGSRLLAKWRRPAVVPARDDTSAPIVNPHP